VNKEISSGTEPY